MKLRFVSILPLCTLLCFGQALPDRDELIAKFKDESTEVEAGMDLVKHYQMGGLRSIIRNLNDIPYERAMNYGSSLRYVDLNRFGNDLNTLLGNADGPKRKALFLMLLSTMGRSLHSDVFEPYIQNENEPMYVRLAAAGGIIKRQDPARYDRFHELANDAVIEPGMGKNDFLFADLDRSNRGFFFYTKSKVDADEINHGAIISMLSMVGPDDTDVYEILLDKRRRKYFPMMIDRAVQVGGVKLLQTMADNRRAKRFKPQIDAAMPAARAIAEYYPKLIKFNAEGLALGPALPLQGTGSGAEEEYRAGFAIVKVDTTGAMSIVTHQNPFGGSDDLNSLLSGRTFPAHNTSWVPVETYYILTAM
jgi:hypothetical protein